MTALLLTRPEADARAFAKALGVAAVIAPLQRIAVTGPLPPLAEGLIFTSANGVAAYSSLNGPGGLPAWCVGPRTGRAAEEVGLLVQAVAPTADDLVKIPFSVASLTHLHGRHTRGYVARRISESGVPCRGVRIYEQHAQPLSEEAQALLNSGQRVVVPLFSPRSAALFMQECPSDAWGNLQFVAISNAVSKVLGPKAQVLVSKAPDRAGMIEAAQRVLERP